MPALRGTLTDPAGEVSVEVEGSIEPPGGGARKGEFEFQDSDAVIQGALEGKTFHLSADDGSQLDVRLESVSTSGRSGFSRAEFTSL
jgi:hypothetical protein